MMFYTFFNTILVGSVDFDSHLNAFIQWKRLGYKSSLEFSGEATCRREKSLSVHELKYVLIMWS
jgi:hypothetical protein